MKLVQLGGFITKKFVTMHGHMNVKLVHLVGFITKKFVTMHGHMNVKKKCYNIVLTGNLCTGNNISVFSAQNLFVFNSYKFLIYLTTLCQVLYRVAPNCRMGNE